MSSPKSGRGELREKTEAVRRRPAADVLREMESLARLDRASMTAPVPRAPRPPGWFFIVRRPPLPPPPPPINPYIPDTPDRARRIQAAAISTRARQEVEEYIRPLMEEADAAAAAPRKASPPRDAEDFYDLARWSRRRWL